MKPTRHPQQGAALLTAMIIVTLVASLASAMVWRQYRAVQIEAAERARAQSSWILRGALDWASLIISEGLRGDSANRDDDLTQVWAVPLAEARLSTFLAADSSNAEDGPEAFLSGKIEDAQGLYNLRNLVVTPGSDPTLLAQELLTLQKLCQSAGVPPETAQLIVARLPLALALKIDTENAPLAPQNLDQVAWFGLGADTIEKLRPLVTLLPLPTPVNVNTAPREVIAALFDGMDLASAERIVQARPFKTQQALQSFLPNGTTFSTSRAAFVTSYFFVTGRLRLDDRVLEERSLVHRMQVGVVPLVYRQRVSQLLTPNAPGTPSP